MGSLEYFVGYNIIFILFIRVEYHFRNCKIYLNIIINIIIT